MGWERRRALEITKCSADNTPTGQASKTRGQTAGHELVRPTGHDQPLLAEGSHDKSGTEPSEHPAQGCGTKLLPVSPCAAVHTGCSERHPGARKGWETCSQYVFTELVFKKQKTLGNPGRKRMTTRSRWTHTEGRRTPGKDHGLQ